MRKWIFGLLCSAGLLAFPGVSLAAGLVKAAEMATIYYVDNGGVRHTFPNAATYRSWYGNDFSRVQTITDIELAALPLGRNVTMKPGKRLVKVPSAPTVYAVERGGVLRPISSSDVAAAIYGPKWATKVVDLSEAFFSDYVVGESLVHTYELPSSIVYQVRGKPTWYWKRGSLLQPFSSWPDVVANGYSKEDVVVADRTFPTRTRQISGVSPLVVDPAAKPDVNSEDCVSSPLNVAFVLVHRGTLDLEKVAAVEQARKRLPSVFAWATRELGELKADWPVVVLSDDGLLTQPTEQGGRKLTSEVVQTFYDINPDVFDFLLVFTDFTEQLEQPNELARQVPVTNEVFGLHLPLLFAADLFGSAGKLKSVLLFNDIGGYDQSTVVGKQRLDNLLLHEIAHQWSSAVEFRMADGMDSRALLREDGRHWSYYAGFVSPVGGSGWRDNGDGTFTSRTSLESTTYLWPYADLDLYLMGLLPWQAVQPFFYVAPTTPGLLNNTISGKAQTVTIEQVIAASGKRKCELTTKALGR